MRFHVFALVLLGATACTSGSGNEPLPTDVAPTSSSLDVSTSSTPTTTFAPATSTTITQTSSTTTVPSSTSVATTQPPPQVPSSSPHVAATNLCVLGWWDGNQWVPGNTADPTSPPPVESGEVFDVAGLAGVSRAIGGEPRPGDEFGPAWAIDVDPKLVGYGSGVAVSGGLDLLPRLVVELPTDSPEYTSDARAVLTGLGLPDVPIEITAAVAVDLDGNGVDEVVFTAEHPQLRTEDFIIGGFSLLVVRREIAGTVEPLLAYASTYTEDDLGFATSVFLVELNAVADLNGDGRMELVLDGFYYEGLFAAVFEYDSQVSEPDAVLSCGSGV